MITHLRIIKNTSGIHFSGDLYDIKLEISNGEDGDHTSAVLKEATAILLGGGLVAVPTETVYGLSCDATNPKAVQSIYEAKNRPSDNPLILHVSSIAMVQRYIGSIEGYEDLLNKFWPGPLTIIVKNTKTYFKEEHIAVRLPAHPVMRACIHLLDRPIAAPSANTSTKASPTHYKHVLMDMNGKINMILGVEDMCEYGLESTVIDCVNFDHPVILRPGGVTLESIQAVKGYENTAVYKGTMSKPSTPGMKYKHYAPQHAQVVVINYERFEKKLNEIISSDAHKSIGVYRFYDVHIKQSQYEDGPRIVDHKVDSLKEYGKYLFHAFRVFDEEEKVECIVTHTVPLEDEGRAIMNRLQKAATQVVID